MEMLCSLIASVFYHDLEIEIEGEEVKKESYSQAIFRIPNTNVTSKAPNSPWGYGEAAFFTIFIQTDDVKDDETRITYGIAREDGLPEKSQTLRDETFPHYLKASEIIKHLEDFITQVAPTIDEWRMNNNNP